MTTRRVSTIVFEDPKINYYEQFQTVNAYIYVGYEWVDILYQVPAEGEHRAAAHFPASRPVPGGRLPVSLVLATTCVILTRFFQGDLTRLHVVASMSDNVVWVLGQERDGLRKRRRHEAPAPGEH